MVGLGIAVALALGVVLAAGLAVELGNGCNAQSASVALSSALLLIHGCDPAPPQALNKASRLPLMSVLYCIVKSRFDCM